VESARAQSDRPAADLKDRTAHGLERDLRLLGLIAILDPPRAAAAQTIAACQAAGITPVLITGDHPATARSIATTLGIIDAGQPVIDCHELPDSQTASLDEARVFARATPKQKLRIIEARRRAGDVVAMTGDGVNDGPALRRDAPLFFANADDFRRRALATADRYAPVRWFVLNVEANVEVDFTALEAVDTVRRALEQQGSIFALARVKQDLLARLDAFGLIGKIGTDRLFPTLPTAVQAYERWVRQHPADPKSGPTTG
jgi:hypothetical protein